MNSSHDAGIRDQRREEEPFTQSSRRLSVVDEEKQFLSYQSSESPTTPTTPNPAEMQEPKVPYRLRRISTSILPTMLYTPSKSKWTDSNTDQPQTSATQIMQGAFE
ncbi:hypothetical protein Ciccas_002229 [Cichlidogyrus casuarinus]|uniref:Uncharacterized protein n=1 Tax=Cichlidogyrus casuarinus TaxID=1844966 RepID=A0ABD2QIT1_9PLAT